MSIRHTTQPNNGTSTAGDYVVRTQSVGPDGALGGTAIESSKVFAGSTALTPKFAFANIAASQSNASVVALVASKKLRVLALVAQAGGTATDITFQSNNTAKTALFANAANGALVLPFNPVGWFETVAGEAIKVTTGTGATTGIQVVYVEV
jgi:hypothetical protein